MKLVFASSKHLKDDPANLIKSLHPKRWKAETFKIGLPAQKWETTWSESLLKVRIQWEEALIRLPSQSSSYLSSPSSFIIYHYNLKSLTSTFGCWHIPLTQQSWVQPRYGGLNGKLNFDDDSWICWYLVCIGHHHRHHHHHHHHNQNHHQHHHQPLWEASVALCWHAPPLCWWTASPFQMKFAVVKNQLMLGS